MKTSVLVLSVGLGLAVVAGAVQAPPKPAEVVREYKKLKNLTPKGVMVNPELARQCATVQPEQIKRAEETHGPHTYAMITVYVNPLAEGALKAKAKTFPTGSVVVKEKRAHARRNGVTGMIKREAGFDPKNGDWEYFIQEEGGKLESGKLATCIGCHAKAKGPDHLFTTWLVKPKS